MGIFKSEEEKQNKKNKKMEELLAKYELNNLNKDYINAVKNINDELAGSKGLEFGNLLAPNQNVANQIQIQFLSTLVQQNWIIIRELNEIIENTKK